MRLKNTIIVTLISVFANFAIYAQQVQSIVNLGSILSESSGLLYLNQKLITHNDSQGDNALFELDSLTGLIARKVIVANASNVDWEDLASDSDYIYIGDFGNNGGDRTNLRIYRIAQLDYWNTLNDTVYADTIRFNYLAQTSFTSQPSATNFDCEAMTIINDSIYLFSKNWLNQKTYVYVIPKSVGNYSVAVRDSLSIQGLITSADFNIASNRLMLTGNTPFSPFIVEMDWNSMVPISQISRNRYSITVPGSIQVEAIAPISNNEYYLTAEAYSGNPAELMRLNGKNGSLSIETLRSELAKIYPNPTKEILNLQFRNTIPEVKITLCNLLGENILSEVFLSTDNIQLNVAEEKGSYLLTIQTNQGIQIEKINIQ